MPESGGEPPQWQPSAERARALAILAEDPEELARQRKRLRRNGIVLIVVMDVLIIAVGLAARGDLAKLETPEGTAASYVDAGGSGDCDRFISLETPFRHDLQQALLAPTTKPGQTIHDVFCRAVAAGWSGVVTDTSSVTAQSGGEALVHLTASGPGGKTYSGFLVMSHAGGHWRVGQPATPCPQRTLAPAAALCTSATFAAEP